MAELYPDGIQSRVKVEFAVLSFRPPVIWRNLLWLANTLDMPWMIGSTLIYRRIFALRRLISRGYQVRGGRPLWRAYAV